MTHQGPILAATDFSAQARHAAERAAVLAQEVDTRLALLHVQPGEPLAQLRAWLGPGSAAERQVPEAASTLLAQLVGELGTRCPVPVDARLGYGAVLDEILREADACDARLIVTGARGTGFLRRLVVGSTAERLMRRTQRPLLVVRQMPHEPYRRVLVALDFSPWSREALALAMAVAPQARLVLLAAFEVPFEGRLQMAGVDAATIEAYRREARLDAMRRLQALAEEAGLPTTRWVPCVVEGDPSLRIVEAEQMQDCDLTVLGKHGRPVTADLLLGSVTKHVLAEGSADVLVSTAREA